MANLNRYEEKEREIRDTLKQFEQAAISIDNYQRWYELMKSKASIILISIGNIEDEKNRLLAEAKEEEQTTSFKANYERNLISVDYYNIRRDINRANSTAYSWTTLLNEMYSIIVDKSLELFDDVKAHALRKESLELMREDAKRISAMTVDIVQQVTGSQQQQLENHIAMMEERFNVTINTVLQSFESVFLGIKGIGVRDVKSQVAKIKKVSKEKPVLKKIKANADIDDEDEPMVFSSKAKKPKKVADEEFEEFE